MENFIFWAMKNKLWSRYKVIKMKWIRNKDTGLSQKDEISRKITKQIWCFTQILVMLQKK